MGERLLRWDPWSLLLAGGKAYDGGNKGRDKTAHLIAWSKKEGDSQSPVRERPNDGKTSH